MKTIIIFKGFSTGFDKKQAYVIHLDWSDGSSILYRRQQKQRRDTAGRGFLVTNSYLLFLVYWRALVPTTDPSYSILSSYRLSAERGTAGRRSPGGTPYRCSDASAGRGRPLVRYAGSRIPLGPRQNDDGLEVLLRVGALPGWSGGPRGGDAGCRPPPPRPWWGCMSPPRVAAVR
jgi:hypothetical protein